VTSGRYRSNTVELDRRSVCRKTGVSPEAEMDVVTGVELEYSYRAGDGRTRSGVASMPKERSGGPRLDQSCNWEKYGYDTALHQQTDLFVPQVLQFPHPLSRSAQPVQTSQLHTPLAILLLISGQHVLRCQQLSQSLQSRQHGCGINFNTTSNKTSLTQ